MKYFFLIAFLITSLISRSAFSSVVVFDVKDPANKKKILDTQNLKVEGFFSQADNIKIFAARILIDPKPENKWQVLNQGEGLDLIASAQGTHLLIGSLNTFLHIKNQLGQEKKLEIIWKPMTTKLVTANCKPSDPKVTLDAVKPGASIFVAQYCQLENDKLSITVSTLAENQWVYSSLFEVAGKGERWRTYQVPAWTAQGGAIADWKFKDASDQEHKFKLVAPKDNSIIEKEELEKQKSLLAVSFENTLKLSSMSLGYDVSSVSAQDTKYAFAYGFLSPKYFDAIRFGGSMETSFEISKKDDALSYLEALMYSGYYYPVNDKFDIFANLVFQYADFQQKSTNARMQNTQLGVMLGTFYFINPENRISFDVYKTTFTSPTVKGNLAFELEYKHKFPTIMNGLWMGLFFKNQTFDAQNDAGDSRQFKESSMGVLFAF